MHTTETIPFDYPMTIETKDGYFDVTISGTGVVHYEKDYGADVDGNRGIPAYFCDDLEVEFIYTFDEGNNYKIINISEIKDYWKIESRLCEHCIEKYKEKNPESAFR